MKILGLMSGTSMDGLDCCLADLTITNDFNLQFNVLDTNSFPYSEKIQNIISNCIFKKKYSYDFINDYL